MQTVKLTEFLEKYQGEIAASIIRDYPPRYQFSARDNYVSDIKKLQRKPYLAQFDSIGALAELFSTDDSGILVGEMGVGKTIVAIGLSYVMKFKKVLVMCPPHLVKKWEREIKLTIPTDCVECHHLKKFPDVDKAIAVANDEKLFHFFIVGRERAKLSYQWRPAYNTKLYMQIAESPDVKRVKVKYITCPKCGGLVLDEEGIPLSPDEMKKKKMICAKCGEFLWQAKETGPRRYAIAEYIKRGYKDFFDLLVVDECHEYKGRGSAQGYAAGILASACKKSLAMTGTLFGGYSSTLFHLLYRLSSTFKKDYEHSQVSKWIDHYGIWERVTKCNENAYDDNTQSKGRKYRYAPREKPGISPVILPKYLLDRTVFIRLSDIAIDLPPLREEIVDIEMNEEQYQAYDELYDQLRGALLTELQHGNRSLLAVYLQTLLTYPDRCTVGEQVYNKEEQLIAAAPALNSDVLYPKEQAIIDLIKKEKAEGRRVLVFCTHTNRRDVTARLQEKIQSNGNNIKSEILKASVPAEKREAWIQEHAEDLDCLITNPALVQTGLDLIEFSTVAYYQAGYSVYTLRQSSRRSWRIGQDKPVKIYYFVYGATMQEQALKLLALKMKASLIIEGELGEDGLATYSVGEDNLFYELARNIANNVTVDESLDNLWRNVQEKEKKSAGNDLLIESLDDFANKPDLNGALIRPVAEIKQKYDPEIWDKLYNMMLQDRGRKQDLKRERREKREKRSPEDRHQQMGLF
jgi:superfamily II DNA or RNA helicase/ribosomal protein S27AE